MRSSYKESLKLLFGKRKVTATTYIAIRLDGYIILVGVSLFAYGCKYGIIIDCVCMFMVYEIFLHIRNIYITENVMCGSYYVATSPEQLFNTIRVLNFMG